MTRFDPRRRRALYTLAGGALSLTAPLPAWAASHRRTPLPTLSGRAFDLTVGRHQSAVEGRTSDTILVNGTLPGPLLRWREGEDITLRVTNTLDEDTSIHWHGILLPFQMDGVPGVTFPGIRPGETFTYRFNVRQAGTYWYHSHSGLQEQAGHYGPIVIDPAEPDGIDADREIVLVLSDFTRMDPMRIFSRLKKMGHAFNFQQRTVGEFFRDVERDGLEATLSERAMWGRMRMNAADIADVTGATYTYLVNGHGPADDWTALYAPGERLRLRIVNASAMSIFDVRIPGVPMTVVHADGLAVAPVETDEFQIGVAETFDVLVEPPADRAVTFVAESIDRSGLARATLTPRPGLTAPVPALRERPTLTMRDMAMRHAGGHGGHDGHAMRGEDSSGMRHRNHTQGHARPGGHEGIAKRAHRDDSRHADNHTPMRKGHASHAHDGTQVPVGSAPPAHDHPTGPGVVGLAEVTQSRLDERPIGLADAPHRVLVYADLRTLDAPAHVPEPDRTLVLHLTSNMERYMWSFDGVKFSEVDGPIVFDEGERVRLMLVNDTMMPHPIHLHGMFFDIPVAGPHGRPLRKHTVVIKPGETLPIDIHATEPGDWAFHCHLLYHMHAGMMRVVSVRPRPGARRV